MDQGNSDEAMDTSPYTDSPSNSEDNIKPVEDGSILKPDDNPDTSAVCTGFENSSHSNMDPSDPDMTVAIFGSSEAVQFESENILLGEREFPLIVPLERKISEHRVSVINMIGSHEADLKPHNHVIGQLLNENQIHAFVFVVRLGQLSDADKMGIEWLQSTFGDRALSFVVILFTYEREEECDAIIDELKNNSILEQLLEKCGGRYHSCSKLMNNQAEMRGLIDKIKQLISDNNQQCYTREMYRSSLEDLQNSAETKESIGETNIQPLGNSGQTDKEGQQKLVAEKLIERIHLEDKHRKLSFSMEGASVAVSIFIPVAIIIIIILSIYFYFSRVQGKSLRLSMSTSPQYDHIRGESAFENPIYETTNNERPMIQSSHQRFSLGFCCKERACKES